MIEMISRVADHFAVGFAAGALLSRLGPCPKPLVLLAVTLAIIAVIWGAA